MVIKQSRSSAIGGIIDYAGPLVFEHAQIVERIPFYLENLCSLDSQILALVCHYCLNESTILVSFSDIDVVLWNLKGLQGVYLLS